MKTTKVRGRLAAFLILLLLACQMPGLAGKPAQPMVDPKLDPKLVAIWREARRIGSDSQSPQPSQPGDPLLIGFFADGTFKAVFASQRFETYHDFWGEWRTEGDTLVLTITGGNRLPAQSTYRGRYEVREKELVLHDIVLVGDFAGPTMIFTYERPADSKTV
jgi:hypothetical protein